MEDKLIQLIVSKEFSDLSSSEKSRYTDWFENEEDFNNLKELLCGISSYKAINDDRNSKMKADLDAIFVRTYPTSSAGNGRSISSFKLLPSWRLALPIAFGVLVLGYFVLLVPKKNNLTANHKHQPKKEVPKKENNPNVEKIVEPPFTPPSTPQIAAVVPNITDIETTKLEEDVAFVEKSKVNDFYASTESLTNSNSTLLSTPEVTAVTLTASGATAPASSYNFTSTGTADRVVNKKVQSKSSYEMDKDANFETRKIPSVAQKPQVLDLLYTAF